jgi:hypothetical protein
VTSADKTDSGESDAEKIIEESDVGKHSYNFTL